MKRVVTIAIYIVGAMSVGYLALYAWTMFTRPQLVPGEPIRIFEKEGAPRHSMLPRSLVISSIQPDGTRHSRRPPA